MTLLLWQRELHLRLALKQEHRFVLQGPEHEQRTIPWPPTAETTCIADRSGIALGCECPTNMKLDAVVLIIKEKLERAVRAALKVKQL